MYNGFTHDSTEETNGLFNQRQKQYSSNPPVRSDEVNYRARLKSMAMNKLYVYAKADLYAGTM